MKYRFLIVLVYTLSLPLWIIAYVGTFLGTVLWFLSGCIVWFIVGNTGWDSNKDFWDKLFRQFLGILLKDISEILVTLKYKSEEK